MKNTTAHSPEEILSRQNRKKNQRSGQHAKPKKKNNHFWEIVFFILISLIVLLLGIAAGATSYHFNDLFQKVQPKHEILTQEVPEFTAKLNEGEPFSVLLIGTDDRVGERARGRADTIMVATVNPNSQDIKITSIPRDTLITLPGTPDRIQDKINATYAYGYVPYLEEAVEELLQIPIDAYAIINFEGLVALVDAVGGVKVNSEQTFRIKDETTKEMVQIDEGRQILDGRQALGYARMRKEDPEGDMGRQKRQQEIIQGLVDQLLTMDTFSNYTEILKALEDNIETNVTTEQAQIIFADYRQAGEDIDKITLEGQDDYMYFPHYGLEVYVYDLDFYSRKNVRQILERHLEIEDFVNELDENFDAFIEGFPFYSDNAVDELDLEEYVDKERLEQENNPATSESSSYNLEGEYPSYESQDYPVYESEEYSSYESQ